MTSRARARAAGLNEDHLIDIWGGASAIEPRDWVSRDVYYSSPAQEAALDGALTATGVHVSEIDALELYSCFPCVPKMARRTLGLPFDAMTTVAGGLTFFGAPLSSYMTHAIAAMVWRLRKEPGTIGLLYGQGEFVTKHHALVIASQPSNTRVLQPEFSVQTEADRRRGAAPQIIEEAAGKATVELYTIFLIETVTGARRRCPRTNSARARWREFPSKM